MQVNDKLKPCPFCGGKAKIQVGEYKSFVDGYAVRCGNCSLTFGACGRIGETYCWSCCFETEEEAIEAWNTRAECTCHMEPTFIGPATLFNMQEYECSECGKSTFSQVFGDDEDVPKYCSECGAKVVFDD